MKLDTETIEYLANLARLELTAEEKERYAGQLSVIFEYIDQLSEVNTDDVPETSQVTGLLDVIREDVAVPCDNETHEKLIASFPETQGRLLKVKAVFKAQEE
jgi:aspartyl-tRNA(Asn)/glutamyl-tRNA(Gln) amidotransferase subunit C